MRDGSTSPECRLTAALFVFACRLLTGIRARWLAPLPEGRPRVYYANHTSHLDGLVIWASMPRHLRPSVRPVAAADYWLRTPLRRYLAERVFRAVLIERARPDAEQGTTQGRNNALPLLREVLEQGHSLILFPEGTRGRGEEIGPFKSGLWHLARKTPQAELVPVYLENLNRVLPKGSGLVVPVLCSATLGEPIEGPRDGEDKNAFLTRARNALKALAQ